jgi:hypothetical protein
MLKSPSDANKRAQACMTFRVSTHCIWRPGLVCTVTGGWKLLWCKLTYSARTDNRMADSAHACVSWTCDHQSVGPHCRPPKSKTQGQDCLQKGLPLNLTRGMHFCSAYCGPRNGNSQSQKFTQRCSHMHSALLRYDKQCQVLGRQHSNS